MQEKEKGTQIHLIMDTSVTWFLIPISKLKNLPQNLSGDSNIMSGDNSDKEGDPDQEYAS